jgi:hypothetical protein
MSVSRTLTAITGSLLFAGAGAIAGNTAGAANAANTENTGKGTLHLYEDVNVQGKQLKPGDYRVEWNGSGDKVEVSIHKGKETIATVPARIVSEEKKPATDGYTAKQGADGTNQLSELFFHGKDYRLEIEPEGSSPSGGNGAGY